MENMDEEIYSCKDQGHNICGECREQLDENNKICPEWWVGCGVEGAGALTPQDTLQLTSLTHRRPPKAAARSVRATSRSSV